MMTVRIPLKPPQFFYKTILIPLIVLGMSFAVKEKLRRSLVPEILRRLVLEKSGLSGTLQGMVTSK
jgi:hypothetical protein